MKMMTWFSKHAWLQCSERSILPPQISLAVNALQKKLRRLKPEEECMIIDRNHDAGYVCAVHDNPEEEGKKAIIITVIDEKDPFIKRGTKVLYHKEK